MSANPSIVRGAFAPEVEHELTMEAVLVLESIGCRYLTGGNAGLRDAVLVWLAMTDLDSLKKARRLGTLDATVEKWAEGRKPADLVALQPAIKAAVEAAFAPAADPDEPGDDPLDSLAKKKPAAAGGG